MNLDQIVPKVSSPDCGNGAGTNKHSIQNNDMPVLSLAGCYDEVQVRMADQAMYHQGRQSVFVGGRL